MSSLPSCVASEFVREIVVPLPLKKTVNSTFRRPLATAHLMAREI